MYLKEHFPTFLRANYYCLVNNVKELKQLREPETIDKISLF